MRKKNMKQLAAFLLSLLLTMTMLAGCASESKPQTPPADENTTSSQESEEAQAPGAEAGEAFTLPFGDGETDSLTLACLEGWYSVVSMNDNLEIWQEVEKRTGVKINWEATADYDTVMQPRVASGSELPDIFIVPPTWSNSGVYKLAMEEMIQPLDDLIAQYAPDIRKVLEEDPDLKAMLTAPDGHIYTIADTPKYVNDLVVPNALFIRQDWLDTLGLEQPTTLDEWHEVLTAFKNGDPNGNGLNDEIPLSGIALGEGLFNYFLSAADLPAGVGAWWYDENGQVFCPYVTDEYREFIAEMNRWYSEGLIDMELTRDEANFQALCATNVVGAFSHLAERDTQYNNLLETSGFPQAEHALVNFPEGSGQTQILKRPPTWSHYAIPTSSKNAELAIKWMNFVWGTEEGVTLNEWGIEGKSWQEVDGEKQFTDFVLDNPDGLDPYNALRSMGAGNTLLVRTPEEIYAALNSQGNAISYAQGLNMIEPFPDVMSTPQEQEILNMYQTDFDTYYKESLLKFITGADSMENYQTFVDTLTNMGLEELTKVKQAQLDRSR